jgi:hypothetical protein
MACGRSPSCSVRLSPAVVTAHLTFVYAGTYAVQGIFFLVLSGPLASIAWAWQFAASSLAACRLVLHTHREGAAARGASASSADSAGLALTTFVAGLGSDDIAEET